MTHPKRIPDPHEAALIHAFVVPEKRARYLILMANPKARERLIEDLVRFQSLDPRFAHRIAPREQRVETIYRLLREKGAPAQCHVIGTSENDGRDVALREELEAIVSVSWGNFLSCIPGKLAYFGGEGPNERYILER